MTATTATDHPELRKLRQQILGINTQRTHCRLLLEVAVENGADTWVDRIRRELNEWDNELDHLIETAAARGYGPDDI